MSELLQRYIRISFLNTLLSSAFRINTVWVQYMVTLLEQNNIQKKLIESRDIDENDIVQWLGETFGIFRRLAVEWRRQAFVYDVIGNMAMSTSIDARGE